MYIRKVTHNDTKNQKGYHTFKLVESIRTERGPRQRMLLNLGTDFTLPEKQWKDLANHIEEILIGQESLFSYPEEIETLANRYARKIIRYHGETLSQADSVSPAVDEADYQRVDINNVDNEHLRSIGAEHVVYETIKALGLEEKLKAIGFNKPALDTAIGVIAARMIAPSSERATHVWLQQITGIGDLLDADFSNLSQDRVYKVSDMLLRHKAEIEGHLREKERSLLNLKETIILYDLTNTFFEGSGKYNSKAHFGVSKEKRSDCPLVTLGLVLDADGFPKKTNVFEGNVSEPGTLHGMIDRLVSPDHPEHPIIVMDAGLATEATIQWLKDHGYAYIVVSRKKKTEMPQITEMVTVREDKQRLIRAIIVKGEDGQELELYCHSTAKEVKESGIRNRFERRFEEQLTKVQLALKKKGGTKRYEKVVEKIGRLKERFKRVARRYEIIVVKNDKDDRVATLTWEQKEKDNRSGFYCLRSNRTDFKEQELFDIFSMLTDIEDAFRCMKSELGLRPVYHQKEHRVDGHLFITVLAYHIMHTIRYRLRSRGLDYCWTTIRNALSNHMRLTTTMKRDDGQVIHIRKSSRPEPFHVKIYDALNLPHSPGKTIKTIL
jgi:transposase